MAQSIRELEEQLSCFVLSALPAAAALAAGDFGRAASVVLASLASLRR